ncbi:GMC family oxidoreductase [Pseudomonas syringae]|uniref:Glucose-methanol-choline oxidoreductase n=4 Tax=Pseudomonas syringae TaxID=317 RepID=A0A3M4LBT2_PSESF|nr:GMC family oxidoreductase N-terminal domain-containing protein [Pseudomonas syringae]EPM47423.1 glucose-methanol-choline oxidoreductase [Pseudomonas syringae pv. actinidiae ICMP 19098]EPN18467.1 glucose-methanol-choline oxidoreductase [Pseudomonas syringae pv. actinidiae ICMP 19100]EPN25922.1 glucose-methanol-choline oxidoreductase [Pseudomonas syringae pv. actinidiae ICMP 19099]EPN33997.1 glucose-methanol-choline oxidoreductase [Pseudomonas syringae pv. actinidiae ICMP 18883]EPN42677.1 glu
MESYTGATDTADFARRVEDNQRRLKANLKGAYDYIVCGSGTSGSVVARRLAENPDVSVLLLEAGGTDDVPSVTDASIWFTNLGSERDWQFQAQPNPHLNNRAIPLSMGKVLGGGSSINVMVWARGHSSDWDHFASESGDPAWNYQSTLATYRRIENWQGTPDALRRGTGGLVFVQPAPDPNPIAPAMLGAVAELGMPVFDDQNGAMMEGAGGAAPVNMCLENGRRRSIFRSYVYPLMAQPNLTVLAHTHVLRVLLEGKRAVGVEVIHDDKVMSFRARQEVVLSLGAINTPKVLMLSGIGDAQQLVRHGIARVQDLPGVGQNYQDHIMVSGCIWEYEQAHAARNNAAESTFFWKSDPALDVPDIQTFLAEMPIASVEAQATFNPPASAWSLLPGLVRPISRGSITLSGSGHRDALRIDSGALSEPEDLQALVRAVEFCREIGNSSTLRPFVRREVMPGKMSRKDLESFVRNTASTVWHQSGTARMGVDELSVVDAQLRVYGIDNLRVADASIMPRVTTGNTMAPCVIIGERLGSLLTGKS